MSWPGTMAKVSAAALALGLAVWIVLPPLAPLAANCMAAAETDALPGPIESTFADVKRQANFRRGLGRCG